MKKASKFILIMLMIILCPACGDDARYDMPGKDMGAAQSARNKDLEVAWRCTTKESEWQDNGAVNLSFASSGNADINIDTSRLRQEVKGFGGAFNEKGWAALSALEPERRDACLKALFDPAEGAKFNICRVPIGASDYAISRYTLNDTKDDYGMNDFSIDRDRENLIPYIKAAMKFNPDLAVWGSAWTPPPWMKTNGSYDGGYMKDEANVYKAYALYLALFVESYQAEGINLYAVAVQNEPGIDRNYPSCMWEPEQYRTFIKDYMGPLFEERGVNASIMLGTMEDGDFRRFPALLADPDVNKYVSIVGFQWGGIGSVAMTREYYPDKLIYQTETECGNFYWKPGYDPDRPPNDWAYGVYTWNKIKDYFDEGVNAYLLWNMVLDEEGKSIDSQNPWPQNAAVTVDLSVKEAAYTPMFYAVKHFSYYVQPGARCIDTRDTQGALAFLNPDGSLVIELQNESSEQQTLTLDIDGGMLTVSLPGTSWNTFIVPKH